MVVDSRTLAGLGGTTPQEPGAVHTITQVLTSWDGRWYLEIIRHGYPSSIPPNITYSQVEARAAFFPVYPMLARAVDVVLPGGDTFAAIFLNIVLGAVAVLLVGLLARELYGVGIASRAMVLFAVFPGSFVLSFTYSEATLIVLAAACLLFLLPRAVVARRHRGDARHGDAAQRCGARGGLRGGQFPGHPPGPGPGARSWRWSWHRSVSSSSSCTSTTRPANGERGSASGARPGRRGRATAPPRCRRPPTSSSTRCRRPPTRSPRCR